MTEHGEGLPPLLDSLDFSRRGRRALVPMVVSDGGPVTFDDLRQRAEPVPERGIAKIRAQHHQLARCIAMGHSHVEAAAITGYTPVRIGMLLRDPTFAELVNSYTSIKDAKFGSMMEKLATLGESAVEEIMERLDEDAQGFSTGELQSLVELAVKAATRPGTSAVAPAAPLVTVSFVNSKVSATADGQVIDGESQ